LTQCLGVGVIERFGKLLASLGKQMAVAIARDTDGAVPEVLLHFLHVSPVVDQQRSAGVPKIVESQAIGEVGLRDRTAEMAHVEVVVTQWLPCALVNTYPSGDG
jgi:hypothetical protein